MRAEVVIRLFLHSVCLRFDEETTPKRIDRVRHARFLGDDLLGAQGNRHGMFRRQCQCFIERIGMQGLCAAQDSRKRLNRHTDNIVLRLLRG